MCNFLSGGALVNKLESSNYIQEDSGANAKIVLYSADTNGEVVAAL